MMLTQQNSNKRIISYHTTQILTIKKKKKEQCIELYQFVFSSSNIKYNLKDLCMAKTMEYCSYYPNFKTIKQPKLQAKLD